MKNFSTLLRKHKKYILFGVVLIIIVGIIGIVLINKTGKTNIKIEPFEPIDIDTTCIDLDQLQYKNKIVINSQDEYEQLIATDEREYCSDISFPVVDFNNQTILGYLYSDSECSHNHEIYYQYNEDTQTYQYILQMGKPGLCEAKLTIFDLIIVEKVTSEQVNFEVRDYSKCGEKVPGSLTVYAKESATMDKVTDYFSQQDIDWEIGNLFDTYSILINVTPEKIDTVQQQLSQEEIVEKVEYSEHLSCDDEAVAYVYFSYNTPLSDAQALLDSYTTFTTRAVLRLNLYVILNVEPGTEKYWKEIIETQGFVEKVTWEEIICP